MKGASAPPIDEPLSKSATAHPLSRRGNHSDTAFVAPGQLPASPSPSANRQPMKLRRPVAERRRDRRDEYHATARRQAAPRAEHVDHAARERLSDRVRHAKADQHPGKIGVRPAELRLQIRRQDAERLPIDVVDDG